MADALIATLIYFTPVLIGGVALLYLIYFLLGKWGDHEAKRAEKEFMEETMRRFRGR